MCFFMNEFPLYFLCCTVEFCIFFKFNFLRTITTISSSGVVKKDPHLCLTRGILTKGFETGDYSLDLLAGINDPGEDYGAVVKTTMYRWLAILYKVKISKDCAKSI
jgi:hypothetical protein